MSPSNSSSAAPGGKKKSQRIELMARFGGRGWFFFYVEFCWVMTDREAVFVQRLINLYNMADKSDVDEEEYFRCTTEFLNYPPLRWSQKRQDRLFTKLGKKGYVLKKITKTTPPIRYVYIDVEKIQEDIDKKTEGLSELPRKKW